MKAAVMGKSPAPVDANTDGSGYCNPYALSWIGRRLWTSGLQDRHRWAYSVLSRREGHPAWRRLVGSDDLATVVVEVTVPTFQPGELTQSAWWTVKTVIPRPGMTSIWSPPSG